MTTEQRAALLERAAPLQLLERRLGHVRDRRRGRLVLVGGEAGVGKSTLVRAFAESRPGVPVLQGSCDALNTPRPLGPFADLAEAAGGELAGVLDDGVAPDVVVAALGRELRETGPAIVVLEDLHWADDATLDALRLLARRIDTVPALVVATFRDDELEPGHPLRLALGELPRDGVDRLALEPLSVESVAALAGVPAAACAELHRRTGGNPFFVTEVLAAGDGTVPETVRDAVLARVARLDDGPRRLLDAVAVVPHRAELWLLEALAGERLEHLDACLASGILRADGDTVGFRHEIARVAVDDAVSPGSRLELHRAALAALAAAPGRSDLARLAHHAEAAGDAEAVLRYAPAAGERAARLRSHREAAAQFGRALAFATGLPPAERARLLERRSYECYLTDRIADAAQARRGALAEHLAVGDRVRAGDAHRWLSRLAWFTGDNATAEREAQVAIDVLEPLGPGRELGMAYANMAQLRMLAGHGGPALRWAQRAVDLGERLGEREVVIHARTTIGTALYAAGRPTGWAILEETLAVALGAGLEEHAARAYTNLASVAVETRDPQAGQRHLDHGIAYSREHDLGSWLLYMTGYRARAALDQGRWADAGADARAVLAHPGVAAATRFTPLLVIGRLRARRGEPGAWPVLDEALELARGTGELQRLGLVAAARAEARWLAGQADLVAEETDAALALALERREPWAAGELLVWRRRAGLRDAVDPHAVAEPFRLELDGDRDAAARAWTERACPYEAALAVARTAPRRAAGELRRLGAVPAAERIARCRATTRRNPAGLTNRELDVLELVAQGLRNGQIAQRLYTSERTIAHHVSAILRKLDVQTRGQAGAKAARLRIVER